ncbi:MAG: hypothetical protein ACLR2E_01225 [Lachnospiraceae bacterium]
MTCIDDGRPEEAVIYLTEAYQLAEEKNLGEIACAEPAWNLARAYRLLGDEEKEKSSSQKPSRASGTTTRRSIRRGWLQKNGSRN